MDNVLSIGWAAGIVAVLVPLLTVLLTKGVDGWLKIKSNKDDHDAELIDKLNNRITTLESMLATEVAARIDCIRNIGILEGRVAQLGDDMGRAIARHDRAQSEHVELLKTRIAELESSTTTT